MIADQKKPTDRADMREFIRRMASNDLDSLHAKNKEAIGLPMLCRMSVSCNEEESDLKIIPQLHGLEDKILLFKCEYSSMPMTTADPGARAKFAAAIRAELPALLHSVLGFKIPDVLKHERFGIKGYMHHDLLRLVRQLDPEEDLLVLIRDAKKLLPTLDLDRITAAELHNSLFAEINLRDWLRNLAYSPRRLGQLLGKLAERNDGVVSRGNLIDGYQQYTITL